jgi:hypothetical protein
MLSSSNLTKVFISYSHKDKKYLDRLHAHLIDLERKGMIDLWSDTKIPAGANWRNEIENAIQSAKVAILLISADFLASKFVTESELPLLLTNAKAEGTVILPVILSPCSFKYSELSQFQAINDPSNPLTSMSYNQKEELWTKVAETIRNTLPSQNNSQKEHSIRSKNEASIRQHHEQASHITCLVALPSKDEEILLPALREVLELFPYYWQVTSIHDKFLDVTISGNALAWLKRANAFIVDISEENSDIILQIGTMLSARQDEQPLILLKRQNSMYEGPDGLEGFFRISYPVINASDEYTIHRVADALRDEFAKYEAIQRLNRSKQAHYLSPLMLEGKFYLNIEIAEKLSQTFITMQNVRNTGENDFKHRAIACGLPDKLTEAVRQMIIEELQYATSMY